MAFPNPPTPGQVYDHPNGLEYVYNADTNTWDLVYQTGTNTGSLPLINPSNYTLPTSLPEVPPGLVVQADYNAWLFEALQHVNKEANIEVEAAPGPTDPDEGRLWYNSDTGRLYLYYNDGDSSQWVEIVGGSDVELQNLESVLTEGNVADKGIILTDGTDAAIGFSPTEALMDIASDTSKSNPKIRFTHIDKENYPDSQFQIELDSDGTRADFEFLANVESAHFNFDNEDKFVLNKDGDAEFTGKLKAAAADTNDELPTLGQVLGYVQGLQSEIDQITDSKEMGEWVYDNGDDYIDQGEYTLSHVQTQEEYDKTIENLQQGLADCMVANQDNPSAASQCQRDYDAAVALVPAVGEKFTTNDWVQGEEIEFAFLDTNGATHTFNTVKVGQYIDMVNEDGTGFMLGEITRVAAGMWYENPLVYYNVVKSFGTAQGKVRVRIFSVTDGITSDDLTNFVRKDGDEMTGQLKLTGDAHSKPLLEVSPSDSGKTSVIFAVNDSDGRDILEVQNNGQVFYDREPDSGAEIANKAYVDSKFAALRAELGI